MKTGLLDVTIQVNSRVHSFAAMEFHHVNGKDFSIGNIANRKWEVIKKELDKCELLCSNCHRLHTWEQQGFGVDFVF